MPLHSLLLPGLEPVKFSSRLDEELHLHLLELPHSEDELTCHNLISESLSDLCNAERNLHAAGLLNIQIIHENALRSLRTQIDGIRAVRSAAHRGAEHKVELADFRPIAGAADRAYDTAVDDNLAVLREIIVLLGLHVAVVDLVIACLRGECLDSSRGTWPRRKPRQTSCVPFRPPCSSSPRSFRDSPRSARPHGNASSNPCCR